MGAKHVTPRELMGKRRTPGEMRRVRTLLRLARVEFGRLAWSDRLVVVASALGEVAKFTSKTPDYFEHWQRAVDAEKETAKINDARDHDKWPDPICECAWERPVPKVEVRPDLIRWLLTSGAALRSVHARGVQVFAAHIPGLLNLGDAVVHRPFWCYYCVLRGVLLRGAKCRTIGLQGCLLTRSEMPGSHACALNADGAEIGGAAFLRGGFRGEGEVRLVGARIAGDLVCRGGSLINPGGDALQANSACVEGVLYLRDLREARGVIGLTRCNVGYLADRPSAARPDGGPAWPERIRLTGFRYDGIYPGAPLDARDRLAWLENHDKTVEVSLPDDPPDPQPYRQLAETLKSQGRNADARRVLFGFEKKHARKLLDLRHGARWRWHAQLRFIASEVYRLVVGYGYFRTRALGWLALLMIVGAVVFGYQNGRRMQPTQMLALRAFESAHEQREWLRDPTNRAAWMGEGDAARADALKLETRYPTFNPFVYSLDTLIPLVGFQQEAYWTPRGDPDITSCGSWWRTGGLWSGRWWTKAYLVFHISMGWVIATLFAASFTRLMRHD